MRLHMPQQGCWPWLVSALVGMALVWLSVSMGERPDQLVNSAGRGLAMLKGEVYVNGSYQFYLPMFQNRVLLPLMQAAFMQVGFGLVTGFIVAYGVTIVLGLRAAWHAFGTLSAWSAVYGLVCWFAWVIAVALSFVEPWIQGTEFLELFFLGFMICAIIDKRWFALVALTFIAAFNRETAIYGAVFWAIFHGVVAKGFKAKCFEFSRGAVLAVLGYLWVLLIRYYFGGEKALENYQSTTWFLNAPILDQVWTDPWFDTWWLHLIGMLVLPVGLFLSSSFLRNKESLLFLVMALLIARIVWEVGVINEIRLYLPAVFFLLCSVCYTQALVKKREVNH